MPTAPAVFRSPGYRPPVARKREFDGHRRQQQPWRKWYSLAVWASIRRHQLTIEPLCRECAKHGRVVQATICDHVEPHRGVWAKFIAGPFQSLCKRCHDRVKQAEERAAQAASDEG